MPNQKGIAHILVILLLLAGVALAVYLVQTKTNLFPHAESIPISVPVTPSPPTPPPTSPPTPTPTPAPIPTSLAPVIRMYLRDQGIRFWTTQKAEVDLLTSRGWLNEGTAFNAFTNKEPGTIVVERMYLQDKPYRFLTTQQAEIDLLKSQGWLDEGAAFYVYPTQVPGSTPVYRMYLRDQGIRFWTISRVEADYLKDRGWIDEGIAFYSPKQMIYTNQTPSPIPTQAQLQTSTPGRTSPPTPAPITFGYFLSKWGTNDPKADLNHDGTVNLRDYLLLWNIGNRSPK